LEFRRVLFRSSCLLSYTDHVPLKAIYKELSRHESNSQQAIIMELSCEESCCSAGNCQADDRQESCSSAGNCQADEQTVITQLSRPDHVTEHALFTWLIIH